MEIPRYQASFLISIMGISSIFGKVGLGYLSDCSWINRIYLYNTCLIICGLSERFDAYSFLYSPGFLLSGLIISKFCHIYATQIAYCAIFGLTEGAYIGLTSVITIDIMGMETFVHAYGVQLFFMGAACVTGPPLIGENNMENLELN